MDKAHVLQTLKSIKETSPKRNFKQSIDLMINTKGLDLKKQDNRVDVYAQLHYGKGKTIKICGLVGPELIDQAKKVFDTAILSDDFPKLDKKAIKKLAKEHVFFVAQANIMPQVATAFGKVLGPRALMPNPKAGCVVPPNANLQAVADKLHKTVRIKLEKDPLFQTSVGREDTKDEELVDNVMTLYNTMVHALPGDQNNIKDAYLKLTMGKAVKIAADEEPVDKEVAKEAQEIVEPKEEASEAPKSEEEPQAKE